MTGMQCDLMRLTIFQRSTSYWTDCESEVKGTDINLSSTGIAGSSSAFYKLPIRVLLGYIDMCR
jgi:hypothetical protein